MEPPSGPQPVELYVYDLTSGMAALLSPAILGHRIEGVWHTSVVMFEREYFYGAGGVTSCAPGGTVLGAPLRVERLGETHIPYSVFVEYLQALATTTYTGAAYHLLDHNCNHFSDEVSLFACGAHVPKQYVQQQHALPPPLRHAVSQLVASLQPNTQGGGAGGGGARGGVTRLRQESPEYQRLNTSIEEARAAGAALGAKRDALKEKMERKQRRKERKQRKQHADIANGDCPDQLEQPHPVMAEALAESPAVGGAMGGGDVDEPDARTAAELKRRQQYPPILFGDINGSEEFDKLLGVLESATLSAEQAQSVDELRQYLVGGEGSWVLGDDFLQFVGSVLREEPLSAARVPLLRCLAAAALRDDISLVLHQDRREHALVSHAHNIDRLAEDEQTAVLMLLCNLFASISSSEWLLYISEWEHNGQQLSNIRTTTKVCVHGVLSADALQRDIGTALLYNLAGKEVKTVRLRATRPLRDLLPRHARAKVFDEVCAELALAALQLAGTLADSSSSNSSDSSSSEECCWRALWSLARLVHHSADVPQLVAMVGPDPNMFRGMSPRIDEQIDVIMQRVK